MGRRSRALLDASSPRVFGAALAAAAGPAAAADVTRDVMVAAMTGRARPDARTLVERAVLRAVREAPHTSLAAMSADDREVVALARLAGYSVAEVAQALGIAPSEARLRMVNGLRAVT